MIEAIYIAAAGMAIVFVALGILLLVMWLLTKLPDPSAGSDSGKEGQEAG